MTTYGYAPSRVGLGKHGIVDPGDLYWNLPPAELYEHALRADDGRLATNGAIICRTGEHTGRSPDSKFLVDEPSTSNDIWWGPVNRRMSEAQFDSLHQRLIEYYRGRRLYVRDMFAGAEESSRLAIRVVTETAWHNLFAAQLFIRPPAGTLAAGDTLAAGSTLAASGTPANPDPPFTILSAPGCQADPATHGTPAGTFIVIHFGKRLVLIGGTAYAGEIKKSVFTIMNYLLPVSGVLSMHCSANIGPRGDVVLFFGLSGTGKTTLSADPHRRLIGDDEHGWGEHGVFNIEGGCYAKCIGLTREREPQIFEAIRFGTVLENVVMDDKSREVDFGSSKLTENTRAAYPLEFIPNAVFPSVGDHPKNVVFLTCDAFGVLPPISVLTPEQAMYHFLSGYTAKIAGTETGITEPRATFSACFGAPFLPLPPDRYATMLGERLARHNTRCWLVNTGWTGGGAGVGERISLRSTRAMVKAALAGEIDQVAYSKEPVFDLSIPESCPGVSPDVLTPRRAWRDGAAYDARAKHLVSLFESNFHSLGSSSAGLLAAATRG